MQCVCVYLFTNSYKYMCFYCIWFQPKNTKGGHHRSRLRVVVLLVREYASPGPSVARIRGGPEALDRIDIPATHTEKGGKRRCSQGDLHRGHSHWKASRKKLAAAFIQKGLADGRTNPSSPGAGGCRLLQCILHQLESRIQ